MFKIQLVLCSNTEEAFNKFRARHHRAGRHTRLPSGEIERARYFVLLHDQTLLFGDIGSHEDMLALSGSDLIYYFLEHRKFPEGQRPLAAGCADIHGNVTLWKSAGLSVVTPEELKKELRQVIAEACKTLLAT